jgi:hypothetical protein
MAGAFTLAEELADTPDDPADAFRRYQTRHCRLVDPKQRRVGLAAALMVPRTRAGIAVRNLVARAWL